MYVKFIFYPENEKERVSEKMVDCASYDFNYDKDDHTLGIFKLTKLSGEEEVVQIVLTKTNVFIMSDRGKTIDRYSWAIDTQRENKIVRL